MAQKFEVEITDYLCENFWVKSNEKNNENNED